MSVVLAQDEEHVREVVEHFFDLIVAPLFLRFKPSSQEIFRQFLVSGFLMSGKEKCIPSLLVARMAGSVAGCAKQFQLFSGFGTQIFRNLNIALLEFNFDVDPLRNWF